MVSLAETPLTGEPDAGEPPVRFGGRGGANPAIPTPIMRCRDSPRRLRGREAFGVHQLAGAVGLLHCCRKPTAHPYLAGLFHARTCSLLTRRHCPFEGRVPRRPDGNDCMEGSVPLGPRDAVERIPPCPPGPSEVAKCLECTRLVAPSKSPTVPGDLPPLTSKAVPRPALFVAHHTKFSLR